MKFWNIILGIYRRNRGTGHTRLAINTAKQFNGVILAATEKDASQFRSNFIEAISMTNENATLGRGQMAIVVDNRVVIELANECQLLDNKVNDQQKQIEEKDKKISLLTYAYEETKYQLHAAEAVIKLLEKDEKPSEDQ